MAVKSRGSVSWSKFTSVGGDISGISRDCPYMIQSWGMTWTQTDPISIQLLKPNPHLRNLHRYNVSVRKAPVGAGYQASLDLLAGFPSQDGAVWAEFRKSEALAYNIAYARFFAKVRGIKTKGELGVTFAQSRQQIAQVAAMKMKWVGLAESLIGTLGRLQRKDPRMPGHRNALKLASDEFLALKFGLLAAIEDIKNSLGVVLADHPSGVGVRAGSKVVAPFQPVQTEYRQYEACARQIKRGSYIRCVISARVDITNENTYLLNQLGLLNPARVAWDLIPWSWVVGMFFNANQLINSLTDTVGIELRDASRTYHYKGTATSSCWTTNGSQGSGSGSETFARKERVLMSDGVLPPKFVTRIPDLDTGLLVTASALLLQRLHKLTPMLHRARLIGASKRLS